MMKTILSFAATFVFLAAVHAASFDTQIDRAKALLHKGSIENDTASVLEGYKYFKEVYSRDRSVEVLYFVAQSEYELVRLGITDPRNEFYARYIDEALEKVDQLKNDAPDWSEAYALSSALYSYRIAYNSLNAVSAGPKAFMDAEKAVELDSANPRAWLARGIVRLNMPAVFGGSDEIAIECFQNAIGLFESNHSLNTLQPSWGYLDALVWLGWTYQQQESEAKAKLYYEKALSLEPNAVWVKKLFLEKIE